MESRLIQEIRLEQHLNKLLTEIDYQLKNPIECNYRGSSMCFQCIYNVGSPSTICSKTE
ncbi:hypothetical protein [Cellulosilyticum sp. I15G10I2]|uniref:hypothetical protein n=1 Tax=Cellulosilyticum sp. I15G10I2 TaxID=1892843 RepID=UPI0014958FFF|nr:hypothetical protein [Cellulosilyticum sp. I15G10I2]